MKTFFAENLRIAALAVDDNRFFTSENVLNFMEFHEPLWYFLCHMLQFSMDRRKSVVSLSKVEGFFTKISDNTVIGTPHSSA